MILHPTISETSICWNLLCFSDSEQGDPNCASRALSIQTIRTYPHILDPPSALTPKTTKCGLPLFHLLFSYPRQNNNLHKTLRPVKQGPSVESSLKSSVQEQGE